MINTSVIFILHRSPFLLFVGRMLSEQFDQSVFEMVEHGWDEEVARKALLMQWQKDIEGKGGSRKAQKQFEKTVQV